MFIPIPKGFDPIRGLIGSSIGFLVALLGMFLISLLAFSINVWGHAWTYQFNIHDYQLFLNDWFCAILFVTASFAGSGWLTYSTKTETVFDRFIKSLVIILFTAILLLCLARMLDIYPYQNINLKSTPDSQKKTANIVTGLLPFLATALLFTYMLAKSLWFKDRSVVNAADGQ